MGNLKYSFIAIDGIIGTGKTHLTKLLSQKFNALPIYEEYTNNPFLEQFYANPQQYALPAQLYFLINRYQQLAAVVQKDLFYPYTIADYTFAKNTIFASITLNERELTLFYKIKDLIEPDIPIPDLVIFLQADIQIMLERIKRRGIPLERSITEQYLKLLSEAYNQYFFHYSASPIMIINVDNLVFTEDSLDFLWLTEELYKPIFGINYLNPVKD
jgi:deoxyadenosine/deoxycytidine kinase